MQTNSVLIDHSPWVFTFGSDLAGRHGNGTALTAQRHYGASRDVPAGFSGQSYAIPTKDENLQTLPLDLVVRHIQVFVQYAIENPDKAFQVTRIGCGLAGYRDEDIAPHFFDAPANVLLPRRWEQIFRPDNVFRVVIAGSRGITDYAHIKQTAFKMLEPKSKTHQIEIVSGDAPGVDKLGIRFAKELGLPLYRVPAHWKKWDKPAGHLRNGVMGWMSDGLLAFWDGASPGTKGMINDAQRESLQVRVTKMNGGR
jgi:hypothetical protein